MKTVPCVGITVLTHLTWNDYVHCNHKWDIRLKNITNFFAEKINLHFYSAQLPQDP